MEHLYTLLPREQLRGLLAAVSAALVLPVRLLNAQGEELESLRTPQQEACGQSPVSSITFSLVRCQELLGTVVVGPFLLDDALCREGAEARQSLPVLSSQQVKAIGDLLSSLFAPLMTAQPCQQLADAPHSAPIRKAARYILEHFDQPLSLKHMAKQLHLSPSYFSALFKQQMGLGFREYLSRVRLEEGKRLLTVTDEPISQIAVTVGFADQSSFTKAFQRRYGVTPRQVR